MTIVHLKHGKPETERAEDDAKTRQIVETTLAEIQARGDAAVRELSASFDGYTPEAFRLTQQQIDDLIALLTPRELDDIKFAQEQVRTFAQAQRDSMTDIEVETMPGVILGHKNIPVQSVGCYVPGGKFPMVASAHMSVATASVAGVPRIIACTPPFEGKPNPGVIAAMAPTLSSVNASSLAAYSASSSGSYQHVVYLGCTSIPYFPFIAKYDAGDGDDAPARREEQLA